MKKNYIPFIITLALIDLSILAFTYFCSEVHEDGLTTFFIVVLLRVLHALYYCCSEGNGLLFFLSIHFSYFTESTLPQVLQNIWIGGKTTLTIMLT